MPPVVSPPWGGEVATDVEEIGTVEPTGLRVEVSRGRRVRPIRPGAAIGADDFSHGTLACFVEREWQGTRRLHLLSNSHVIAGSGAAKRGHSIFQPSRMEGARDPEDRIGRLAASARIEFTTKGWPNLVDAAVAVVEPGIEVDLRLATSGEPLSQLSTVPCRGMRVRKIGKATGVTSSIVRDVDFCVAIPYRNRRGTPVRAGFRDQILCDPFTRDGDSGALVVDDQDAAVGLHVAASESGSIFCRIEHVFALLELALPGARLAES